MNKFDTLEPYSFEKLSRLLSTVTPNANEPLRDLTLGEPKFDTPKFIQKALEDSAYQLNKYPPALGTDALNKSILGFIKRRYELDIDQNQMVATLGSKEACFNFPLYYLMSKGKNKPHIAIANPFYQTYRGSAIFCDAQVTYLNLTQANNFKPDIDPKKLADIDLVILNFPNNPTGSMLAFEELKQWAKWALEYDFLLINDECYSEIYAENAPASLLQASVAIGNESFQNIAVFGSLSKRSSAPGLRSGFIVGNETLLAPYKKLRSYIGSTMPLPNQAAAAKAWSDDEHVERFRSKYIENMQLAKSLFEDAKHLDYGFFLWLKVPEYICGGDDQEFTKKLYQDHHIKVLPGAFMGEVQEGVNPAQGFIRIALVYDASELEEPLNIIRSIFTKDH